MVGTVYSKNTGRIRSVYVPDQPGDLDGVRLGEGEAMMRVDAKHYDLDELQGIVSKETGLTPADDRYAIVDRETGDIKGVVIADPRCGDAIDGHDLVAHPEAAEGWMYDKQTGNFTDERTETPKVAR